jgi:hypothetical protein
VPGLAPDQQEEAVMTWPAAYPHAYPAPPEPQRVTAYAYVYGHGLMARYGTLEWLFEIGRRAAGEARWLGLEPMQVWEGPYWVHTWPEELWARVIASLAREEKTAFADAATAQDDGGMGWPPMSSEDM